MNKGNVPIDLVFGTRFKYKRVDISTIKGIKKAERLQSLGWKVIQSGLFTVLMEKDLKRKEIIK